MKPFFIIPVLLVLSLAGCSLMVEVKDPPANNTSNINNANNVTCGDGIAQATEACDDIDLRGETCLTQGYALGGTLGCTADCSYSYANCQEEVICGDNIRQAEEACDGDDLGDESCVTQGFPFGILRCTTNCSFDPSDCSDQECSLDNFQECNPAAPNDCCPNNDQPSTCLDTQAGMGVCMQTCTQATDCDWSLECLGSPSGVCYYALCGQGAPTNQDLNAPCSFEDGRQGTCDISNIIAMTDDNFTTCNQSGLLGEGNFCDPNKDPWAPGVGEQDFCAAGLMCMIFGTDPSQGNCVPICDPVWERDNHTTTCTGSSHCVNLSTLVLESTDPRYLLRTLDRGVCTNDQTCDLLTGLDVLTQMPCNTPQTCQMAGWGSLTGICSGGTGTAIDGMNCIPGDTSACVVGLVCTIADPLHENDPFGTTNYACRKPCDATLGETNNPICTAISGSVCISTSRFFTSNHELPDNPEYGVETSPSPLGFCVPSL